MTINELLSRKKIIQVEIKQLKTELDEINSDLEDRYLSKAKDQLLQNCDKQGFGTTIIQDNDKKVSVSIRKKVTWDTPKLLELSKKLDNPNEYINLKCSVLENKYKSASDEIKNLLCEARTVEDGTVSIEIID